MKARLPSADYYEREAAERGLRYSRARFEDIHADILGYLPAAGAAILDVGAGSGRDAAALASRGYKVVAVEPAAELAQWGRSHYAADNILWVSDALPDLTSLVAGPIRYSFILCSAVLMHLSASELDPSFATLGALLLPGGHLALSLRDRAPQDPPAIFHDHSHARVIEAAAKAGFDLIQERENSDQLERPDLLWRAYLFRKKD